MKKKLRVAIIFGGKSAEHEVSLLSAKGVIDAIDKDSYELILIGIAKNGKWYLQDESNYLVDAETAEKVSLQSSAHELIVSLGNPKEPFRILHTTESLGEIDVIFPMLHGTYGEDGSMQGLLTLLEIPFVGAGILGSAASMDKEVMKQLIAANNIHVAKFIVLRDQKVADYQKIKDTLGLPLFVKPSNLGSSVGISKVRNEEEFNKAIEEAFKYDTKVLVEEFVDGDEIFVSVLGNQNPNVSLPGKLITDHEFYDYEAKYIDTIQMEIPAKFSLDIIKELQMLSIKAFEILQCDGMARADLFVTKDGKIYFGELNTLPGFTSHSWYPTLWKESGKSYTEVVDTLISLAIDKFSERHNLKTTL